MATNSNLPTPETLPADGMSRWAQFAPFAPISKERFRQLVNEGRAPQPIRLGIRCTMYSNRELHRWLADPVNYRAEQEAA
jgi:prophage regulatory protein